MKIIPFAMTMLLSANLFAQSNLPGIKDLEIRALDLDQMNEAVGDLRLLIDANERDAEGNQVYARIPDLKIAHEKYLENLTEGYSAFIENAPLVTQKYNDILSQLFVKKKSEIQALEELRDALDKTNSAYKILNKNIEKHLSEFDTDQDKIKSGYISEMKKLLLSAQSQSGKRLNDFYRKNPAGDRAKWITASVLTNVVAPVQILLTSLFPVPFPGIMLVLHFDGLPSPCVVNPYANTYYRRKDCWARDVNEELRAVPTRKEIKAGLKSVAPLLFQGCKTSMCVNVLAQYMREDIEKLSEIEVKLIVASPVKVDKEFNRAKRKRIKKMISWAEEAYAKTLPTAYFTSDFDN